MRHFVNLTQDTDGSCFVVSLFSAPTLNGCSEEICKLTAQHRRLCVKGVPKHSNLSVESVQCPCEVEGEAGGQDDKDPEAGKERGGTAAPAKAFHARPGSGKVKYRVFHWT